MLAVSKRLTPASSAAPISVSASSCPSFPTCPHRPSDRTEGHRTEAELGHEQSAAAKLAQSHTTSGLVFMARRVERDAGSRLMIRSAEIALPLARSGCALHRSNQAAVAKRVIGSRRLVSACDQVTRERGVDFPDVDRSACPEVRGGRADTCRDRCVGWCDCDWSP